MTCVRFDNVFFRHPYDDFDVLSGASFDIDGELTTLLVESQCGKTTICRLLTGELKPQKGRVTIDDVDVRDIKPSVASILYLSKQNPFFARKTVADNIAYPLVLRKKPRDVRREITLAVVEKLGIVDLLQKPIHKLTAEQQRLVALARGLTVERRIVLFDDFFEEVRSAEATSDCYDMQKVFALFPNCAKVVVTSNVDNAVAKCIVLDGGKCVFCGGTEEAKQVISNLTWQD